MQLPWLQCAVHVEQHNQTKKKKNTNMKQDIAKQALLAINSGDHDKLTELGIRVFGNKGRMWTDKACITNLDDTKGECNPRLSSNYCTVQHIGCPKCMETLKQVAGEPTIRGEFLAGIESGEHRNDENDAKALKAITSRMTPALVRAYWTGYVCQVQGDGDLMSFAK